MHAFWTVWQRPTVWKRRVICVQSKKTISFSESHDDSSKCLQLFVTHADESASRQLNRIKRKKLNYWMLYTLHSQKGGFWSRNAAVVITIRLYLPVCYLILIND